MAICHNGRHDLLEVLRTYGGAPGIETVARWCKTCGAVVVDTDIDGQVSPGDHTPMRFPTIAATLKAKP